MLIKGLINYNQLEHYPNVIQGFVFSIGWLMGIIVPYFITGKHSMFTAILIKCFKIFLSVKSKL